MNVITPDIISIVRVGTGAMTHYRVMRTARRPRPKGDMMVVTSWQHGSATRLQSVVLGVSAALADSPMAARELLDELVASGIITRDETAIVSGSVRSPHAVDARQLVVA